MDKREEELISRVLRLLDSRVSTRDEIVHSLLSEALLPAPKFYVGQPVLVKDVIQEDGEWITAVLENIREEEFRYECEDGMAYRLCKPDPQGKTKPNWVEVDPSEWGKSILYSDREMCIAVYEDGEQFLVDIESKGLYLKHVVRYCIIPLPQFILEPDIDERT